MTSPFGPPQRTIVAGVFNLISSLWIKPGIIAHVNQDHPDALAAIGGLPGDWRMVTVDVDGFDLALAERVVRFAWSAPVKDSGDVRRELVRMTHEARAARS